MTHDPEDIVTVKPVLSPEVRARLAGPEAPRLRVREEDIVPMSISSRDSDMPRRIQLSRRKGFKLAEASTNPNGVVNVARPGPWGNLYVVHTHTMKACGPNLQRCDIDHPANDLADAVRRYRHLFLYPLVNDPWVPDVDAIRRELAGKDLACWCKTADPCHADVLLDLANGGEP